MGTDDSQKRQRVSKACDNCRRRKVRCDGTQPICSNCKALGITCTYNDTTKKRGPPKGYIEAIESRLHRMEHILGGLVQGEPGAAENVVAELRKLEETHQTAPRKSRASVRTKSLDSKEPVEPKEDRTLWTKLSSPEKCESVSRKEELEFEELSNEAEQLTLDDHGRVRYCGTSSGFYLLRQTDRYQKGVFKMRSCAPEKLNLTEFKDSEFNPSLLPSSKLFGYLLETYFNCVNPIFPLLHKAEFLDRLGDIDAEPPFFLLNSILAIAAVFISSETILTKENLTPETFYERARMLLDRTYEVSSLENIQALILLGIYQHITYSGMRAWLYSGMAIRMAEDLGLHRNPEKWDIEGLTQQEKETRKRVWWVCYQIDRHGSVCVGRPLCIDDRYYDTTLPCIDPNSEIESGISVSPQSGLALKPFVQVIRLKEIIGRIMSDIYPIRTVPSQNPQKNKSILLELDSALHSWLVSLPEGLHYNPSDYSSNKPPQSPTLIYAHMWYHCALILLHRPYIPKTGENYRFPYPSLPICTTAANRTTTIALACLDSPSLEHVIVLLLFPVFTSSTIHLLNATSTDAWIANPAKEYLSKNLEILERVKQKWGRVGRYQILLLELIAARKINLNSEMIDKEVCTDEISPQIGSNALAPGPTSMRLEDGSNAGMSATQSPQQHLASRGKSIGMSPSIPAHWTASQETSRPISQVFTPGFNDGIRGAHSSDASEVDSLPLGVGAQRDYSIGSAAHAAYSQNDAPTTLPDVSPADQRTLEQYVNAGTASTWDVPMSIDFNEWNEYVGQYMVESSLSSNVDPHRSTYESGVYASPIHNFSQSHTSLQSVTSSPSTSTSTSIHMSPHAGYPNRTNN
ncbi:hypothetical protein K493DRAFT_312150 [Basidiobolus meristosporus CBS 931.73]|uniref:Zn(2)-C6 fungal-type domain-containing protein n=1 Tax=Basidiobolus meristosporus CBS 931.73 TaxID=1314790 RepID=A0A1Y1YW36_9FUNG|nr:hypothetical protein K493DRAFT_312150 [Basidiobolus meristosporus CBS 931.73]|eukprot:ORY02156.1 hypothetical protein K493DRAFT_312150 [Basidiobolus meristosporus CBS 931.73]